VIERGTSLPAAATKSDFTNPGPVEHITIALYVGDSDYTDENTVIGEVVLGPLEPLPAGSHSLELRFHIDESGLLSVTGVNLESGKKYEAAVSTIEIVRASSSPAPTPWRRREPLFDYPIALPQRTAYHDIDIELDASHEEVRWAKYTRSDQLKGEQRELQKKLDDVYKQVSGLREAYRTVQDLHGQGAEVDESKVKEAQEQLRALEREAQRIDPEFRKNRDRVAKLEAELNDLNNKAVDKLDKRAEYDRTNPPLALLRLADCARLGFLEDPRTTLFLLRKELAEFLAQRVGDVFHPSDLTREDFSHDFTANRILDGGYRR
jgi:molecular chaperone DnaK (HSP70)